MPPGDGDLDGSLRAFLPLDVRKVLTAVPVVVHERPDVGEDGFEGTGSRKEVNRLAQGPHGIDGDAGHHARLGRVLQRHEHALLADPPHLQDNRQDALHAADLAGKGQFSRECVVAEVGGVDLPRRRQQTHGDRKVVEGPLLPHVRRGQVDGDVRLDLLEARVSDGRRHAVLRLLHRLVGKAHHRELRRTVGRADLDLDCSRLDAAERTRMTFGQHVWFSFRGRTTRHAEQNSRCRAR